MDLPLIEPRDARRLLLRGLGLTADPERRATVASVRRAIQHMGFVQVDSIDIVGRAHHHILRTRFDDYEPRTLKRLLEHHRSMFEHWTHDASILPTTCFRYWKVRHRRFEERAQREGWWRDRMGSEATSVLEHVLERIEHEGPLMSRDFKQERPKRGVWWDWKPQKVALEYLWRTGRVSIAGRVSFQKRYDLTERVLPEHHDLPVPDDGEYRDWACAEALQRLGAATPSEIGAFFGAVSLADARAWCTSAEADGQAVPVFIGSVDGNRRRGVALPGWRRCRAEPPDRTRLLSPFDPLIRDRARAARLFGFDYRFEAFVPAPKRRYGYYVLPILEGDQLVGRLEPRMSRDRASLDVRQVWWEPGVRPTRPRQKRRNDAVERLGASLGAKVRSMPRL